MIKTTMGGSLPSWILRNLQAGRQCYRNADYKKAEEFFSAAAAAIFEKLDDREMQHEPDAICLRMLAAKSSYWLALSCHRQRRFERAAALFKLSHKIRANQADETLSFDPTDDHNYYRADVIGFNTRCLTEPNDVIYSNANSDRAHD